MRAGPLPAVRTPTSLHEGERIVTSGEYLTVDVPPGRYRVRSLPCEPDQSADYYLKTCCRYGERSAGAACEDGRAG
ncbi:hypothetical protein P3T27_006800 [Kitasatospora sp. MAA19]|nr:hypothetical protein [Kitasatospora sp. MAA19]